MLDSLTAMLCLCLARYIRLRANSDLRLFLRGAVYEIQDVTRRDFISHFMLSDGV